MEKIKLISKKILKYASLVSSIYFLCLSILIIYITEFAWLYVLIPAMILSLLSYKNMDQIILTNQNILTKIRNSPGIISSIFAAIAFFMNSSLSYSINNIGIEGLIIIATLPLQFFSNLIQFQTLFTNINSFTKKLIFYQSWLTLVISLMISLIVLLQYPFDEFLTILGLYLVPNVLISFLIIKKYKKLSKISNPISLNTINNSL